MENQKTSQTLLFDKNEFSSLGHANQSKKSCYYVQNY